MDYKKKSLIKSNQQECYEEIDTRLASGWYVESVENNKNKKFLFNKYICSCAPLLFRKNW